MSLEIRTLDFGYPGHPVGHDISFEVRKGEVLCLLGPNGCGKTTLFRTILGLLQYSSGSILLDGVDLSKGTRKQIARHIAYVPQQHESYFPFTVLEVVLMGRCAHIGLFDRPSKVDKRCAEEALENLHITHLRDEIYTRISGGERQLTLIARALAQQAPYLLMDEPTANLDFGNQLLVLHRTRQLKDSGLGIMLSTHDPNHAFRCADRVAMLHHGVFEQIGPTVDVVTAANLRKLYDVDVDVLNLPADALAKRVCIPISGHRGPEA